MNGFNVLEYLKNNFKYSKGGVLNRSDRKNSNGSLDKDGYLIIKIKGNQYKAHRLIWAIHYGVFPDSELDHINRIKNDNRIENLRLANRTINTRNVDRKPNPRTGVIGVYVDNTRGLIKKYTTKLGKKTYRFYTISEALKKRKEYYNDSLHYLK